MDRSAASWHSRSVKTQLKDFITFVREQGIVGLAIGLVLGVAVKGVVDQLVASFIDPLIGMIVGDRGGLEAAKFTLTIGSRTGEFAWGKFVSVSIQFCAVALIVYLAVRLLKVNRDEVKEMSKESAKG
jgi:large conductance mechanosensitive channel protein